MRRFATLALCAVLLTGGVRGADSFGFATWNIGHFSLGWSAVSSIPPADVPAKQAAYRAFIASAQADVIGVCEHAEAFSSDGKVKSADAVFAGYPGYVAGPFCGAHGNVFFWRNADLLASGHADYPIRNMCCYYEWARMNILGRSVVFVETHCDWNTFDVGHEFDRLEQLKHLVAKFKDEPRVVIAGDFNTCWRANREKGVWTDMFKEFDVFRQAGYEAAHWGELKTWPSKSPYLGIDDIFAKGLKVSDPRVQSDETLSDHALLRCTLTFKTE